MRQSMNALMNEIYIFFSDSKRFIKTRLRNVSYERFLMFLFPISEYGITKKKMQGKGYKSQIKMNVTQ